jgi:hypothetical protein
MSNLIMKLYEQNLPDKTGCNRPQPALNKEKPGSFTNFSPGLDLFYNLRAT